MNKWSRRVQERQLRGAAHSIKVRSAAVVGTVPSVVRTKQRPVKQGTKQTTVIQKLVELPNVKCSKIPKAPLTPSNLQKNYGESKIPKGSSCTKVCLPIKTRKKVKAKEEKLKEVQRPRRRIEQIGSAPGSKKKAVTATIKQSVQPVLEAKRRCPTLRKGKEKPGATDFILNKEKQSHPSVSESETKSKKRSLKQKKTGIDHRATKEKTKAPISTSMNALLNLCQSMQHDMNTHEDKGRSNQQSRSDFIDQCLTFSKECDEATGRADRLLEELSLMRCQSRCSTKPAPPSLTTQRSVSCHDMFKRGAMKLARKICLDGSSVRDVLTDSPMDALPQHPENRKWRRSQSDRIERPCDKADRDALSIQESTPGSGTWLQQLAKKPAKQLETPLHVELKICLDRLAKLELENRALKQLLQIKCGSITDAKIEEMLKTSMTNQSVTHGPSMDISPRKLVGMVSMDSACDAKP